MSASRMRLTPPSDILSYSERDRLKRGDEIVWFDTSRSLLRTGTFFSRSGEGRITVKINDGFTTVPEKSVFRMTPSMEYKKHSTEDRIYFLESISLWHDGKPYAHIKAIDARLDEKNGWKHRIPLEVWNIYEPYLEAVPRVASGAQRRTNHLLTA